MKTDRREPAGVPDARHTDEIAALLAVVSEGSFAAAGEHLQRHPSVVSRRVAALEARLGVQLIQRSTRQLKVTPAGLALAQRLRAALQMLVEAEQEAAAGAHQVRGLLRLSLPGAMGRTWLAPLLPAFLTAYPQVSVVADYGDRPVDLIAEGYDAAIRIGDLRDERLVARRLADHRRILCAAPDYLRRRGTPADPRDLAQHACLRVSGLASFPEWRLQGATGEVRLSPQGPLTSDDAESLLAAALGGAGILGAGEWLSARALRDGRLVRVLPGWELDAGAGIHLLRPRLRYVPAATVAFRTWIERQFAGGAPWQRVEPAPTDVSGATPTAGFRV